MAKDPRVAVIVQLKDRIKTEDKRTKEVRTRGREQRRKERI